MLARAREVVRELKRGSLDRAGSSRLQQTRAEIVRGWKALHDSLAVEGRHQLAEEVGRFVKQMLPPHTEKEWLAHELIEPMKQARAKDTHLVR